MAIVELNPRALAVVREGRRGLRPPAGERERLQALLDARLHAAPLGSNWSASRLRVALTLGVGLFSGATLLYQKPAATEVVAGVSSPTQLPAPLVSAVAPSISSAQTSAPQPAPVGSGRAEPPAGQRPRDNLAQEVALLARATSDFRAGHASGALKWVEEHQRKFPKGALVVERNALRAQVLCSLSRASEGRAAVALLAPGSLYAARANQLCEAEGPTPE